METLRFDTSKKLGGFKVLNATSGGPWHKRHAQDQWRSNFEDYKAARIPYSRNHDSCYYDQYGGPYSHDITAIFPNFDADVNDPASYDFACTDESILIALEAGTETFFRLGQMIEHQIKKHGTKPPKDFNKWAEICEHIIRHYNYGWADGFELGIKYWEIWCEPDLDINIEPEKRRMWGGTPEQFHDLYAITAKRLKTLFPELKIGGPSISWNEDWSRDFLNEMKRREVPIDFFSWHCYCYDPMFLAEKSESIKALLSECGYGNAESILNEYNYVRGWEEDFVYTLKAISGAKGAAFVMSCISVAQRADIDMLMYYGTLPNAFCGAFDLYTYEKRKAYYPLYWYGMFYDTDSEVRSETNIDDIYSLCGVYKDGKTLTTLAYYSENDESEDKSVKVDFGREGRYEVYLLDRDRDAALMGVRSGDELEFKLSVDSCVLIKEI